MNISDYSPALIQKDGIYITEEKRAISYPEHGNEHCFQIEENSFWFKHRNACILELVKKYSPDKLFFDIGGGNGFVSNGLVQSGIDAVLVEPGMTGALNARTRGLEHIVCSTLEDAGFLPNSLPSAGLFDVVEHIENDVQFMQSIHRYLASSGMVYITVPAYNWLWSNEDVDAGHYRRYTIKTISELLEKTGFDVKQATYIFSILPLPIFLFRSIPSKLGFNKKSDDLEKHQQEHAERKGLASRILDAVWARELRKVRQAKPIRIGSSCLIAAQKV